MKNLREEIVLELTDCIRQIEDTGFLFFPTFEKVMVKLELFQEKAQSPTVMQLMLILKGSIVVDSYPEIKVKDEWVADLKYLLHVVENIVSQIPEN
jgi:hypothetical protein